MKMQKCWDCAHAKGGCSWADEGVYVKGSKGIRVMREGVEVKIISYCPEFIRDSYGGGQFRLNQCDKYIAALENRVDKANDEIARLKEALDQMPKKKGRKPGRGGNAYQWVEKTSKSEEAI